MGGTQVAPVLTVGHGTLDAGRFADVVGQAGASLVVDVRRFPASRRHPHFAADRMAAWLPEHGLGYRWAPALGGRRRLAPESPNVGLRNDQFRAYADHMASPEFRGAVDDLVALAAAHAVAVMCAEAVWWRCHRRLLADHLALVGRVGVAHLFHDGRVVEHSPTPAARRRGGNLVYDVGAQEALFPNR